MRGHRGNPWPTVSTPSSSAEAPPAACWRTGSRRARAIPCCCSKRAATRRRAASPPTCSIPIRSSYYNADYFWPELKVHWRLASNSPLTGYSQGRIMGGGSSVMGMVALRGTPDDYAEWEELGATGWGWNDVLPFFSKLETDKDFGGEPARRRRPGAGLAHCRGTGGRRSRRCCQGFADERQIPFVADMNGDFRDGYAVGADQQLAGQARVGRDLLSRRRRARAAQSHHHQRRDGDRHRVRRPPRDRRQRQRRRRDAASSPAARSSSASAASIHRPC